MSDPNPNPNHSCSWQCCWSFCPHGGAHTSPVAYLWEIQRVFSWQHVWKKNWWSIVTSEEFIWLFAEAQEWFNCLFVSEWLMLNISPYIRCYNRDSVCPPLFIVPTEKSLSELTSLEKSKTSLSLYFHFRQLAFLPVFLFAINLCRVQKHPK